MSEANPERRRPAAETSPVPPRDRSASLTVSGPAVPPRPSVYRFEELASGQRVVLIRHRGQEYRLTATKAGKLVLNK